MPHKERTWHSKGQFAKDGSLSARCCICGRPVSRHLDNGLTLEILCVTESGNCCSVLYGAASKIAKYMGYEKAITYNFESEEGTSLKASGFTLEDECCGGKEWTDVRKRNKDKLPPREMKQR